MAEKAQLRAEIKLLKRSKARSAAPFSKNIPKKNPQRPGRKAGQGKFSNRTAPAEDQYTEPVEDVPVAENACPDCGGELVDAGEEIVTNTELPVGAEARSQSLSSPHSLLRGGSDRAQSVSLLKDRTRRTSLRGLQKRHRKLEEKRRRLAGKTRRPAGHPNATTSDSGKSILKSSPQPANQLRFIRNPNLPPNSCSTATRK